MGKKGGGGGGTTTTKTEPWDGQKEYLRQAMQAAQQLYNGGNLTADNALAPAYYSGNTVAPQSAWTQQALTMQANAAKNMANDPTMRAATAAAQQIASGKALNSNAGLAQLNTLAASAPVTQKQVLTGNGAMNSLNKLANSDTLAGNSGYGTLNTLAGQATGKGNAGLTALNRYAGQDFNAGNAALKSLQGTTGIGINKGNAALKALQGTTGAAVNKGNAALAQLNQLATNDNPYMDALYQRANNQAQASLDSNFNRAGRYGSGSHEAAAADAANNLADQMYSNLYNQRINAANAASGAYLQGIGQGVSAQQAAGQLYNQGISEGINAQQTAGQLYNAGQQLGVSAAQDAAGAYNQALAQRIAAAQDAGSLYNQDLSTRAGMLSNAGSLYNTGIGNIINAYNQQTGAANNAGSLYNTGVGQRVVAAQAGQQLAQQPYTDAAMLSEAGGVKDDYQQQLINAAIDRYNYEVQRPLQALSTYNQLISGNYGGTSTAQGQQAAGSRLGSTLGGAMTGAGLGAALSGVAGPAALATPWGIGGAVLGGMLGLL